MVTNIMVLDPVTVQHHGKIVILVLGPNANKTWQKDPETGKRIYSS
jgi:hypothetical protein